MCLDKVSYNKSISNDNVVDYGEVTSYLMFTQDTSPISGATTMLNYFSNHEYPVPGIHDDHEGFYIIKGSGMMKINDTEFVLDKGCSVLVPAHTPHAIKKTGDEDLEIFIYHFK